MAFFGMFQASKLTSAMRIFITPHIGHLSVKHKHLIPKLTRTAHLFHNRARRAADFGMVGGVGGYGFEIAEF